MHETHASSIEEPLASQVNVAGFTRFPGTAPLDDAAPASTTSDAQYEEPSDTGERVSGFRFDWSTRIKIATVLSFLILVAIPISTRFRPAQGPSKNEKPAAGSLDQASPALSIANRSLERPGPSTSTGKHTVQVDEAIPAPEGGHTERLEATALLTDPSEDERSPGLAGSAESLTLQQVGEPGSYEPPTLATGTRSTIEDEIPIALETPPPALIGRSSPTSASRTTRTASATPDPFSAFDEQNAIAPPVAPGTRQPRTQQDSTVNTLTFDNPTPAYNSNAPTREELARSDSARSNSEMFAEPPSHSDKREATIAAVKPISRREIGRDPTQVLGGRIEPITHVVRRGENFWTIARHYYGSGRFYRALWKANAERVPKIDEIYVGTPILVPAPEDLDRAYIDPPTPTRTGARQPDAAPRKAALGDSTKDALVDDRAVRVSAESELLFESRGTTMDNHPSNAESSTTGANAPSHAKPRRNRVYIVKPYDTLRSVAAKELGDAHREDELLRLNEDVVDDPYDLPAGTAIRLPWDEPR